MHKVRKFPGESHICRTSLCLQANLCNACCTLSPISFNWWWWCFNESEGLLVVSSESKLMTVHCVQFTESSIKQTNDSNLVMFFYLLLDRTLKRIIEYELYLLVERLLKKKYTGRNYEALISGVRNIKQNRYNLIVILISD